MKLSVLKNIVDNVKLNKKMFTVLIDPDKVNSIQLNKLIETSESNGIDFFFVGGSLLSKDCVDEVVSCLKENTQIPVILFPSNSSQIADSADAILFLSLISGRNPEYLIGNHVISAPILKQKKMEIISTGYMLIDCGKQTTASYISNTTPIPYDKSEIAVATALAGEMLGLKLIYADGGSGAAKSISPLMISALKKNINIPLIVGGGIKTVEDAESVWESGADMIVVGNYIEKNPNFIAEVSAIKNKFNLIIR